MAYAPIGAKGIYIYVGALTENIDARFQESSPVLDSLKIFDLLSVPTKTDDGFRYCLLWVL